MFSPLRTLLIALFFIAASTSVFHLSAQGNIQLQGVIYSATTSQELPGAKVEIIAPDSTIAAEIIADYDYTEFKDNHQTYRKSSRYSINIPKKTGMYTIRVSMEGYDTVSRTLDLSKLGSRQTSYDVQAIYLRPSAKTVDLDELVVKTSKVKFYHKGDTIVYNADAFLLPEGSMLDALVKQLPGVEIREGGAIYVNGRYVESLLLNGKDFFKGNQQVMLDNLGAYLVKDIQVYEKGGHLSEMMGKNLADDTQYVMDVKLKKDFMAGNLVNATLTGGTRERYLAKFFGMHYTNNSRIAAYANVNNLNDTDKPNDGEGYNFFPQAPSGLTDTYRGGIDYLADNPRHTWELSGNTDISVRKNTDNTDIYTTNFLPAGNTFDYSFRRPVSRYLRLITSNTWYLKRDSWELNVKPTFLYDNNKSRTDNVAASFSKEIEGISPDFIENLTKADFSDAAEGLINRNIRHDRSRNRGIWGNFYTLFSHKVGKSNDLASIWTQLIWNDFRKTRDNVQSLIFGGNPISATLLNQHYSEVPNRYLDLQIGAMYNFNLPKGSTGIRYYFTHKNEKKNSYLFLLEARRADGSIPEDFDDPEPVFDPANSYDSRQTTVSNQFRPFISQMLKFADNSTLRLNAAVEFSLYSRHLNYHRGAMDVYPKKNDFTFQIMNTEAMFLPGNNNSFIILRFNHTPKLASLVDMVDYRDTSDPLNIQEGNPGLRNSTTTDGFFNWQFFKQGVLNHSVVAKFSVVSNDLVRGYRYDSQTGVRTFKTYNVNGNNSFSGEYNIRGQLPGFLKKLNFSNDIAYSRSAYANMIGEDREPQKQRVIYTNMSESMRLTFEHEQKLRLSVQGRIRSLHTHSQAEDFDSFNAYEFSYGFYGTLKLPFGDINTDINRMSRRGYSQSAMNDNRLIWNMQFNYSVLKGALLFTVKGHDILGQIKNIDYSINAQGRTETRISTLPRYFSLSMTYKFNFKPKRSQQ